MTPGLLCWNASGFSYGVTLPSLQQRCAEIDAEIQSLLTGTQGKRPRARAKVVPIRVKLAGFCPSCKHDPDACVRGDCICRTCGGMMR